MMRDLRTVLISVRFAFLSFPLPPIHLSFLASSRIHPLSFNILTSCLPPARAWTMTTVSYALSFAVVAIILAVRFFKIFRIVPGEEGYSEIA